jgi:cell division protein FtsN
MGLEAYWTLVDLGGKGLWYRVFIGYYNNLESALRIIEAKALNDVKPKETRYANLIGTYSSEYDLERQRRFVAEFGFSPYVIMDDNGVFKLYVGAYVTLKHAEKFSAELKARGIPSRTVER